MKNIQQNKTSELRMSEEEFDKIMRKALMAQPEEVLEKIKTKKNIKTSQKKSK